MEFIQKLIFDQNANVKWWNVVNSIIAFLALTFLAGTIKYFFDIRLEKRKLELSKEPEKQGMSDVKSVNLDMKSHSKKTDSLHVQPSFPAPPNLSNTQRTGGRLFTIGPEEIILGDLTFHVLLTFGKFDSRDAAMSVNMVANICQINRDESLAAVKELHGMGYIRTVLIASGQWNGSYKITGIGRDYITRHAT